LHFSGHGAGEQGLLFVSDESAGAIYRSDSGEVRSRSNNSDEIKFVPAQPLANLLQLCEEHLECVVLNACYSDVQGDAISANIPFTIGMRDVVADNVAIKFSQGFYDAIGAGKGYESAFKWGKVAIEFDLLNDEAAKILVLRKKEEIIKTSPQRQIDTLKSKSEQLNLERKILDRQIKVLAQEIDEIRRQWKSTISDEQRLMLQRRIEQKLDLMHKLKRNGNRDQ
jgi:hypothetical protein